MSVLDLTIRCPRDRWFSPTLVIAIGAVGGLLACTDDSGPLFFVPSDAGVADASVARDTGVRDAGAEALDAGARIRTAQAAKLDGHFSTFCTIDPEDAVRCTGSYRGNFRRILPIGADFVRIEGGDGAMSVATSDHHGCIARIDGHVRCWGFSEDGQTGQPEGTPEDLVAREVEGLTDIVEVDVSRNGSCARDRDGRVWCWGENDGGEIRRPADIDAHRVPERVRGLPPAVRVATMHYYACAVTEGGALWCWGAYALGGFMPESDGCSVSEPCPPTEIAPPGTTLDVALNVGGTAHALGADGAVRSWRRLSGGPRVVEGPLAPAERLGRGHPYCVVAADGVHCRTLSATGQYRRVDASEGLRDAVVLGSAGGPYYGCGRAADGRVACWGDNQSGQLRQGFDAEAAIEEAPVVARDAAAIFAGPYSSCALIDAQLQCWGGDRTGAFGAERSVYFGRPTPSGFESPEGVALGGFFACAWNEAGRVECAGDNRWGQLGNGEVSTEPGGPTVVEGLGPVAEVAVGSKFACARTRIGEVWCWGDNDTGTLGQGHFEASSRPVRVPVEAVVQVATGSEHACALTEAGVVWCWGNARDGRFGLSAAQLWELRMNPDEIYRQARPILIPTPGLVEHLSAGMMATCVATNAALECHGRSGATEGVLAVPGIRTLRTVAGTTIVLDDQPGFLRLQSDGQLAREVDGPAPFVDVVAGTRHTCGQGEDGRVWCWGAGYAIGDDRAFSYAALPISLD